MSAKQPHISIYSEVSECCDCGKVVKTYRTEQPGKRICVACLKRRLRSDEGTK